MGYLIVFLGAGLGGAMRHGVNRFAAYLFGVAFPSGTLTVNIIGSFLMGVLAGYFAFRGELSQEARLFLTTGVLGGFTTFSTFSSQALQLFQAGERLTAAVYIAASVVVSIVMVLLGMYLAGKFFK